MASDTTSYDYGPLSPGTYYFRIMEVSGSPNATPPIAGADSPWTTSSTAANVGSINVSISSVDDAAELGPDNHPQDGYFEITRDGSTDGDLTVSVDLSGTAVIGTQYTAGGGGTSPAQVTIPNGASAALLEIEPLLDGLNDPYITTVTATLEAQAGINPFGDPATMDITELPSLGNVTVTGSTGGSATATNSTPVNLYLPEPTAGSAKITISGALASPHILWSVAGDDNSSTGMRYNFGLGNPTIALSPSGGNQTFTVTVGVDKNGNGVLDANEVQRTIEVNLVAPLTVSIDSSNQYGFDTGFPIEPVTKEAKDGPTQPGKLIGIDSDNTDTDSDGIPDFADGYNLDQTNGTDDDQSPALQFVPRGAKGVGDRKVILS